MNLNQIINMIVRQVTRRLVNKGVDAGIDMASRRGKSRDEMTNEERARADSQSRQGKDMAKRARKARRVTRKLF
ncbi:hypothetical protein MUY21_00220 [Aliiroseovarius sp. S2029]|uniref:hypothetical protein n=1 Tax=Aliiroseovarius sp. S2029 TaxID=2936988 RepID=UPI0020BE283E|nr:hypothetical protein [Aliiroseovarius sp. S2029]MCK8482449.1 hypothetical protein [Aliiroseovarius sp. S2029]